VFINLRTSACLTFLFGELDLLVPAASEKFLSFLFLGDLVFVSYALMFATARNFLSRMGVTLSSDSLSVCKPSPEEELTMSVTDFFSFVLVGDKLIDSFSSCFSFSSSFLINFGSNIVFFFVSFGAYVFESVAGLNSYFFCTDLFSNGESDSNSKDFSTLSISLGDSLSDVKLHVLSKINLF
jgi:hypothetical protein